MKYIKIVKASAQVRRFLRDYANRCVDQDREGLVHCGRNLYANNVEFSEDFGMSEVGYLNYLAKRAMCAIGNCFDYEVVDR